MVGEAYVRVTADTTQMRRALHRAARDSERDMQAFQALIDDVADSQISAVKKRLAGGLVDPKILTRWSKEFKNSSEAAENFRGVINSIRNDFSEMTAKQQKEHLAAINRWEKQAKAAESLAAAEKQRLADEKGRIGRGEGPVRRAAADAGGAAEVCRGRPSPVGEDRPR
jgi:hypothetical protein